MPCQRVRRFAAVLILGYAVLSASSLLGQTNFARLVSDGAWTWFNDPRAVFHNGILYVGYVRNSDGATALSAFNPQTGSTTSLWSSAVTQRDDHNNPGLLVKHDGTMLAIYARHNTDQFFRYRLSNSTNPISPADWGSDLAVASTGSGVTYANPFELAGESNRIYNFMRDLNFNPTVITSTNGGVTWGTPQLFIQTGTGSIRPYVKYCSDYSNRIDLLYTDGHPRDLTNSLYHVYYRNGAIAKTDGTFLKAFSDLPILHDSGERGSVIYQYSTAASNDPDDHIPTGRAWCWQIGYQTNGYPVCVFAVQRDNVTGTNWYDDRIYYYYARWTGTNWQKRFIAQGGRPLYTPEVDYAGGVCFDPEDPKTIYISSNAEKPFDLASTSNVALNANSRYQLYRGVVDLTTLTVTWQTITTNSAVDNLRPYIPPRHNGKPAVIWFRGTYTTYSSYSCEIVGLFSDPVPEPLRVQIINPQINAISLPLLSNKLKLAAMLIDDSLPQPPAVLWNTIAGPTNAIFDQVTNLSTTAQFPVAGTYVVQVTANDGISADSAELTIVAGPSVELTNAQSLLLKLDESSGNIASDTSGNGNHGNVSAGVMWLPQGGIRNGAIRLDGASGEIVVPDADNLDNTSAFSLCYWFYARAYPGDSGGLVCKRNSISDNNAYTTYLKASDHRIYVDIDTGNNRFASATLFNTNEWYHVILTFDGSLASAQRVKLWINGALDVTASESSATITNCTSSVRIGNTHPGATNWFNGMIDDVRFYRRVLSSNEITLLANTNVAPQISFTTMPAVTNRLTAALNGSVVANSSSVLWQHIFGTGTAVFSPSNAPSTLLTCNRAGDYLLRLSASNGAAEVSQDLAVFVWPNTNVFEDWASFYFVGETNVAVIGASADADHDGVCNLGEFGLGLNPTQVGAMPFNGSSEGLPVGSIENISGTNYFAVRLKRMAKRFDLSYDAEISEDLLTWLPLVEQSVTSNADSTETVVYRDVEPVRASDHRFVRLRISTP